MPIVVAAKYPGAITESSQVRKGEVYVWRQFSIQGLEFHDFVFEMLSAPYKESQRWLVSQPIHASRNRRYPKNVTRGATTRTADITPRWVVKIRWVCGVTSELKGKDEVFALERAIYPWCDVDPDPLIPLSVYQGLIKSKAISPDPCTGITREILQVTL